MRTHSLLLLCLLPTLACSRADEATGLASSPSSESGETAAAGTDGSTREAAGLEPEPSAPSIIEGGDPDAHAGHDHGQEQLFTLDPEQSPRGQRGEQVPVITKDRSLAGSQLKFEVMSLDLGEVYQQEKHPLMFPFEVEGEDAVTVKELVPSCGCTDAQLMVDGAAWDLSQPLPPGTKGEIHAVFDSKEYVQTKTSSITVRGNAMNLPAKLSLRAYVNPIFSLKPRLARFASVLRKDLRRRETAPERKIQVTAPGAFEVTDWVNLPDWVSIEPQDAGEMDPEGVGFVRTYLVRLDPDIEVGTHTTLAVGQTTLSGKKIQFQVYAEVSGPAVYHPNTLVSFNMVEQGKEPYRKMRIESAADHVELPAPEMRYEGAEGVFEVTLDELDPNRKYALIVRVLPDAPQGRHSGKVFLSYPADAKIPNREFPVSVLIRKPL